MLLEFIEQIHTRQPGYSVRTILWEESIWLTSDLISDALEKVCPNQANDLAAYKYLTF